MDYIPGIGDQVTWPAYSGHPNDPRTDESDFDDELSSEEEDELIMRMAEYYTNE